MSIPSGGGWVSMKSGLEDRNNILGSHIAEVGHICLNEVRPGRPEQCVSTSGHDEAHKCLNEVRPGRPEQSQQPHRGRSTMPMVSMKSGLEDRNNVETSDPNPAFDSVVSMKSGLEDRNNDPTGGCGCRVCVCLNEVRPGRPEQCGSWSCCPAANKSVSMKSGLEDRNNQLDTAHTHLIRIESQ